MSIDNEKDEVMGELRFLPAEKDSKVGEFSGTISEVDRTMMARTVNAWWETLGEVEKYLRENISTLSPVKAVLGGTWYVISIFVDASANSGSVVYEDGHVQEDAEFTYEFQNGEVSNLIIK